MSFKKIGGGIVIFLIVILIGGVTYSYLEGWSFTDAVYFSAVTITTLGYGDFVPQTEIGKIFTIIFSLSGIAIGLYIISSLGKSLFEIEIRGRKPSRITIIRKGRKFDVSKLSIGQIIEWKPTPKESMEGEIFEMGLDYIKVRIAKKDKHLVPKKEQKSIILRSKGLIKVDGNN